MHCIMRGFGIIGKKVVTIIPISTLDSIVADPHTRNRVKHIFFKFFIPTFRCSIFRCFDVRTSKSQIREFFLNVLIHRPY